MRYTDGRVTKPEKDGTMELDVGQIDLLDLALPPEPKAEAPDEPDPMQRVSKGPPPLPPSLPPISAAAPPTSQTAEMSVGPTAPPAVISARTLLKEPPPARSSLTRFLLGMGAATAVCVIAFLVFRAVHKTPPAAALGSTNASAAATPAPTHAFTMAPIEFTSPVSSDTEPESSSTASAAPVRAGSGQKPPTAQGSALGKPPHSDDVIKVEN
jgi:hypothetical protein